MTPVLPSIPDRIGQRYWLVVAAILICCCQKNGFAQKPAAKNSKLPRIVEELSIPKAELQDVMVNPAARKDLPQAERIGLRAEERETYYAALRRAADADQDRLTEAALAFQRYRRAKIPAYQQYPDLEFQAYVDLADESGKASLYQGHPVRLKGRVRDWREFAAGKNEAGIKTLYELWLYDNDSQQNPAVILCTELPKNFPDRDQLIDGVAVTGYFFKIYGYRSKDRKVRYVPMLIAKTVEWSESDFEVIEEPFWLYIAIGIVLLLIIFAVWWSNRRFTQDKRSRRNRSDQEFTLPDGISEEF